MISNLQARILDIVSVSRYVVDDNSHTRLLDSKKPDMALHRKIQKNLQHIRDEIDDVYYVYTMTGNDKGEIVFLVDADVNPQTLANPIILMSRAAEKIGRGDFEQRVRIKRKDELGDLNPMCQDSCRLNPARNFQI